jgi:hypothetical protein
MTTHIDIASAARMTGVKALCRDFKIPLEAEARLLDTLAYCDAQRFSIPYASGLTLTLQRPFGSEMRRLLNNPELTAELLYSLDHRTCDEAGLLELIDRVGAIGMFHAVATAIGDSAGHLAISDIPTRIAPVAPDDALPLVREAMATFVNDAVGMKASPKKDFKQKRDTVIAVPGRMADFLMRALAIAGWEYTATDISANYEAVLLKREWDRRPRPTHHRAQDGRS